MRSERMRDAFGVCRAVPLKAIERTLKHERSEDLRLSGAESH